MAEQFFQAVRCGDEQDIRRLLPDRNLDEGLDSEQLNAIGVAAHHGRLNAFKVLLNAGANPDLPDQKFGQRPLFRASIGGHVTIVEMLLQRKDVDVNAKADWGQTALGVAAHFGRSEIVKLLLNADIPADRHAVDDVGRTALDRARFSKDLETIRLLDPSPLDPEEEWLALSGSSWVVVAATPPSVAEETTQALNDQRYGDDFDGSVRQRSWQRS